MASNILLLPADGDFTGDETTILTQEGVFKEKLLGGKRKVSASLLSPPNHDKSWSSSSSGSSTASVRLQGFSKSPPASVDFELPTDQDSVAALEFVGFNKDVATKIHSRWCSRPDPDQNTNSLLDYAMPVIMQNELKEQISPADSMTEMGLSQELQDILLNPRFGVFFTTETLHFWVRDTLRLRYQTIYYLQQRCHNMAIRSRHAKKKQRKSVSNDPSLLLPQQGGPSDEGVQDTSEILSMSAKDLNLPEANIRIGVPGPALDDHYTFYSGKMACEMEDMISEEGSIQLTQLSTFAGGDFNALQVASYWTPEKATAERYREWAAHRCDLSESWLIQIQVSRTFMTKLRQETLWYSPDWKEFVWYCKKKRQPPPAKFDHLNQAQVIRGHVCNGLSRRVIRIKREDVQNTINEAFVLRHKDLNEEDIESQQVVFIGESTIEQLAIEVRGKMHIDVTASLALVAQNTTSVSPPLEGPA